MNETTAYILIEAHPGKALELVQVIKDISGVQKVDLVTGPYDIIVFAGAPDLKTLGDLIVKRIQSTNMVTRTLTCITVEQ